MADVAVNPKPLSPVPATASKSEMAYSRMKAVATVSGIYDATFRKLGKEYKDEVASGLLPTAALRNHITAMSSFLTDFEAKVAPEVVGDMPALRQNALEPYVAGKRSVK